MSKITRGKHKPLPVLIPAIVGSVFVVFGAIFGLLVPSLHEDAADQVAGLKPVTVAWLGDGQLGQKVLVEGYVSALNPARLGSSVAYIREDLEIDYEGEEEWVEGDRFTPPLLLQLPDGLVQIENSTYDLELAEIVEQDSDSRYRGIEIEEAVIAVGIVVSDVDEPQIEAEFIARGTQKDYIAAQRSAATIGRVLGIVFGAIGVLLLVLGVVFWWRL